MKITKFIELTDEDINYYEFKMFVGDSKEFSTALKVLETLR